MDLAMLGLGKMGMNMAKRLLYGGHKVVVYNRTKGKIDQMVKEGATGAYELPELIEKLTPPRVVWLMLPAGVPTDEHIDQLKEILSPEDIIIDGGNTYYKDDIRREQGLRESGIKYLDAGVSGGIWGLKIGYCTMVGGGKKAFEYIEPLLKTLAPEEGYLYCGDVGAGHFVKMIHNGIEYGMMQAYAEGFEILESSDFAKGFDYEKISHLWNQGSVIRSWLLELAEAAFEKNEKMDDILGYVADSGEGRWTIQQAVDSGVSAPVIALSLFRRFESQNQNAFSNRVLASLRREFGGHEVKSK